MHDFHHTWSVVENKLILEGAQLCWALKLAALLAFPPSLTCQEAGGSGWTWLNQTLSRVERFDRDPRFNCEIDLLQSRVSCTSTRDGNVTPIIYYGEKADEISWNKMWLVLSAVAAVSYKCQKKQTLLINGRVYINTW